MTLDYKTKIYDFVKYCWPAIVWVVFCVVMQIFSVVSGKNFSWIWIMAPLLSPLWPILALPFLEKIGWLRNEK